MKGLENIYAVSVFEKEFLKAVNEPWLDEEPFKRYQKKLIEDLTVLETEKEKVTDIQKRRVYERQGHKCPFCVKNGINTEYAYKEMQGDHIIPWSQGGRTVEKIYRCCARDVITIRVTSKN